jgi:hypothetical protein
MDPLLSAVKPAGTIDTAFSLSHVSSYTRCLQPSANRTYILTDSFLAVFALDGVPDYRIMGEPLIEMC